MWAAGGQDVAFANIAALQLFGASSHEELFAHQHLVLSCDNSSPIPCEMTVRRLDGSAARIQLAAWPSGHSGLRVFQAIVLELQPAGRDGFYAADELQRGLWSSNVDCVKVLSLEGTVLYLNPGGCQLLAVTDPASIQGAEWLSFWQDEHRDAAAKALNEARHGGIGRFIGLCARMNGEMAWWDVVITPMRDAQESIQRFLCISRDVTELKQAQLLESIERSVLEKAASNRPINEVLDAICNLAEFVAAGGRCSLAAVDDLAGEMLRITSAPSIPSLPGTRISRKALEAGGSALTAYLDLVGARAATLYPLHGPDQQLLGMLIHWANSEEPSQDLRSKLETSASLAEIAMTRESHLRRLRTKQERLMAISRAAPVGLYQVDASGKWIYANERYTQLTGLSPDQCSGEGWFQSVYPEDREIVIEVWRSARAGSSEFRAEFRLASSAKGNEKWVMAHETPVKGEGGYLGTITDITELKNALTSRADVADRFQTLVNNISQLCWMTDASGWRFWHSDRWQEYTGMTAEETEGWGWRSAHHPDHLDRVIEKMSRCWQAGDVWEDTYPLRSKHGNYRWFLSRAQPIRDASGKITRWFGTNTDVTELRQLEAAMQRQNLKLQRSNEDLSRFAFIASHDLQEPLRMISSFAQLILRSSRDLLDAKSAGYMDAIIEATGRMNRLIHDLLVYAQASAESDQAAAKIDLNQLALEAMENLRSSIKETGATITHDPLPEVWGVETQVSQVLQNLFSNSLKYRRMEEAPRVHVSAAREASHWRIAVRDNGQGFEQEHAGRVFDFLKRLHGRDVPGSGMGLAICKTVIERNGGSIGADAKPGEGATFWFTLPAANE